MYFAQWSDPDLGDYGDDFAGADVDLSLGYVYNSTDHDHSYDRFGLAPPAVGYDFLQGPVVPVFLKDENGDTVLDEQGEPVLDGSSRAIFNFGLRPGFQNLPMTSFVYFAAGSAISDPDLGDYVGTQQWYNLLRGYQPQPDIDNPVPYTNPLTGEATFFTLDGDPTHRPGLERRCPPALGRPAHRAEYGALPDGPGRYAGGGGGPAGRHLHRPPAQRLQAQVQRSVRAGRVQQLLRGALAAGGTGRAGLRA